MYIRTLLIIKIWNEHIVWNAKICIYASWTLIQKKFSVYFDAQCVLPFGSAFLNEIYLIHAQNATNQVICRLNGAISLARALKNFLKSKTTNTVKKTIIELNCSLNSKYHEMIMILFFPSKLSINHSHWLWFLICKIRCNKLPKKRRY